MALTLFTSLADNIGEGRKVWDEHLVGPTMRVNSSLQFHAMYMFHTSPHYTGEHLEPFIPIVTALVGRGLMDPSEEVSEGGGRS